MDITMVDVSSAKGVKTGDEVVLFGVQGTEYLSVNEVAALSGTINYEVLCGIGKRVVRVFTRNGKADGVVTMLGDRFASLVSNGGRAVAFSPSSSEVMDHTLEGG
jgi:alanine racemase